MLKWFKNISSINRMTLSDLPTAVKCRDMRLATHEYTHPSSHPQRIRCFSSQITWAGKIYPYPYVHSSRSRGFSQPSYNLSWQTARKVLDHHTRQQVATAPQQVCIWAEMVARLPCTGRKRELIYKCCLLFRQPYQLCPNLDNNGHEHCI